MSVIAGKNVLVVGDETSQVHAIEVALQKQGAIIHNTTCAKTTIKDFEAEHIDIVFLNHLHQGTTCVNLLNTLRSSRMSRVLPIFALVEDDKAKIEHALEHGAADYFTPLESVDVIIDKVKVVLGEPINFSGVNTIDIGDSVVATSKKGVRVLLVEDDPLLKNLLSIRFDKAEFPYEFNSDGKEIISQLLKFKPDLVLLDIMLPGISGFDILEEIRNSKEFSALPVVIFSNRDGSEDRNRAKELGANGFYVKAMTDLSDLITNIEKIAK